MVDDDGILRTTFARGDGAEERSTELSVTRMPQTPSGAALCVSAVLSSGESLCVPDTSCDTRFEAEWSAAASLLVVPLLAANGWRAGAIELSTTVPEAFTEADEKAVNLLGHLLASRLQLDELRH